MPCWAATMRRRRRAAHHRQGRLRRAFERLLGDVQATYSAEDLTALRREVTPEMLSYFSEQLSENASRGLINRVTGVKLEQGDLAEAWREGDRLRDRRHALRTDGQHGRAQQRSHRRRRQPERGHRGPPWRARRQLAGFGHPAVLTIGD